MLSPLIAWTQFERVCFWIYCNCCFLGETCLIASKKGCTTFARQYSLDRTKLAICLFHDYSPDPLAISGTSTRGHVLYSNELHKGNHWSSHVLPLMSMHRAFVCIPLLIAPQKNQGCQLGVEKINPSGNLILFDGNDRYLMDFFVKVRLLKRYSILTISWNVPSRSQTSFPIEVNGKDSF